MYRVDYFKEWRMYRAGDSARSKKGGSGSAQSRKGATVHRVRGCIAQSRGGAMRRVEDNVQGQCTE